MKKILYLLLLLTTGLSACSDTAHTGPTNRVIYNEERYPIFSAFCLTTTEADQTIRRNISFFDRWLDTHPVLAPDTYFECSLPDTYFGQRLDLLQAPMSPFLLTLKIDGTLIFQLEATREGELLKNTETGAELTNCILQAAQAKNAVVLYLSAEFADGRKCLISFKGYPMNVQ